MPQVLVPFIAEGIAVLAGAAGAGATAFTIGSVAVTFTNIAGVLVTGAMVGASLALNSRNRGGGQMAQLPPTQSAASRATPIGYRFYGFGRVSDGGVIVFWEVENHWLGIGHVVDCGPISSIEAVYCDNELLPLTTGAAPYVYGDPTSVIGTVDFGSTVQWPNAGLKFAMRLSYYYANGGVQQQPLGKAPVVFTEFVNATDAGQPSVLFREFFGDHPLNARPDQGATVINWGANHKARGLSMLYTVASGFRVTERAEAYPEFWPKWRTIRHAALVYDPRDAGQDFNDPSTWQWSRNPALCRAWHATHADGLMRGYDEVDWTTIADAADYFDTEVPIYGGGTEPRARCDMQWDTSQERRAVEDTIDISCDGQAYEDEQGRFCYWAVQPVTPDLTFTMRDISSISEDSVGGPFAAYTKFVGVYIEPRSSFQRGSAPEVVDTDAFARIGEFAQNLPHDGIQSFNQSYRIAHRTMRRTNVLRSLRIVGGWTLLRARRKRVIHLDCPEVGIVGDFWLQGPIEPSQQLHRVSMTVVELAADAFDDVVPPRDPVNPAIAVPVVTGPIIPKPATPILSTATVDGDLYIRASVADPGDDTLLANFRIKRTDIASPDWAVMSTVLGRLEREIGPVPTGAWEVRAWFTAPLSGSGDYSDAATISTTAAATIDSTRRTIDSTIFTTDAA